MHMGSMRSSTKIKAGRIRASFAHLDAQHELQLAANLAQARAVGGAPGQRSAAVLPRQPLQDGRSLAEDVHVHQVLLSRFPLGCSVSEVSSSAFASGDMCPSIRSITLWASLLTLLFHDGQRCL